MEFRINTYTNGNQYDSKARGLFNGNFVVTWTDESSHDGSGQGVFAQVFYPSGAKLGSKILVNTYTTGNQHESSTTVSMISTNLAVVWTDDSGLDGFGQGIFGKILYDTYTTLALGTAAPMTAATHAPTTLAPTPVPTAVSTPIPATLPPTIVPATVAVTLPPITNAPNITSLVDDYGIFDTIFVIAGAATLFMLEII